MSQVIVSSLIQKEHPKIDQEDVISSFRSMLRYKKREGDEYLAIGSDRKGRILELVYLYDRKNDFFLIYHSMTPPTKKAFKDLEMI